MDMTKMEYAQAIATACGGDVRTKQVTNDIEKVGVSIGNGDIVPCIWIDEMYERKMSIVEASEIVANSCKAAPPPNFRPLLEYENIKDKLTLCLCNKKMVTSVYRSAGEFGFDDLILVPYVDIDNEHMARVTREVIEYWGVTEQIIFDTAWNNMKEDDYMVVFCSDKSMLSITNKSQWRGAVGVIVLRDMLKQKFPNGYYVLPISTDKVAVSDSSKEPIDMVNMAVKVTTANVHPEKMLSTHAYEIKGGD
jgi:hypothetical protein